MAWRFVGLAEPRNSHPATCDRSAPDLPYAISSLREHHFPNSNTLKGTSHVSQSESIQIRQKSQHEQVAQRCSRHPLWRYRVARHRTVTEGVVRRHIRNHAVVVIEFHQLAAREASLQ